MKKIISVLLILVVMVTFVVSGCSKQSSNNSEEMISTTEPSSEATTVKEETKKIVDNTVTITMPAFLFSDSTESSIKENAKKNGFTSCVVNEDGSVTYTLTKDKHNEILTSIREDINEDFNNYCNKENEHYIEGFEKIEYNEDLTKIDVYINENSYNKLYSMYLLLFYLNGVMYQKFLGRDIEDIDVEVRLLNSKTQEVFVSGTYKNYLLNKQQKELDTQLEEATTTLELTPIEKGVATNRGYTYNYLIVRNDSNVPVVCDLTLTVEDDDGHLLDCVDSYSITSIPYKLLPGEIGYAFTVNDFSDIEASNGMNYFWGGTCFKTKECYQYPVTDDSMNVSTDYGINVNVLCRAENDTEQDESLVKADVILFDAEGLPVGYGHSYIDNFPRNSSTSAKIDFITTWAKNEDEIQSYEIYVRE